MTRDAWLAIALLCPSVITEEVTDGSHRSRSSGRFERPAPRPNSVAEETSATGQRIKGAIKDAVGELTDNESLEEKGERENAAGIDRQRKNDAV